MPFLTWYARQGGKRLLRKKLYTMFPQEWGVYVEPFFGAGNLFFTIPKPDCQKCEVINDLDKDIYYALKDIQEVTKEDIERMDFRPSKKRWESLHRQAPPSDPVERFYRFCYLNWWSYGSQMRVYNNKRSFSGSQRKRGLLAKLDDIQERLRGVIIDDEDYKTILRNYDSSDTFFYLDPPYYNVDLGGYKHKFINVEELALKLKNLKGKFMLSYNDHPYIRQMFSDFKIKTIKTTYTVRGTNRPEVRSELVITNY
jgi:DNA adenine methylase